MKAAIASATASSPLRFDNIFLALPGDSSADHRPRQVLGACYSPVQPTAVAAPILRAWSPEVAGRVGLPADFDVALAGQVFGGNALLEGMQPWAACYGGHQFGNWAGQLGDGRAISLGQVATEAGPLELQLKGAGPTPYSRRGDGRAVLRSSIREFLCSEAMHHLGVPTTRALSLVTTGDAVLRDMFYDGRAAYEPGAVVCRVAPTFIRFGNFEIFAARQDRATLRRLLDHTIAHHFPHLGDPSGLEIDAARAIYVRWLREVCDRTALMVAHWMRVGFVHGVMNTDNMSALGETIDYGPYGWLEDYDLSWTPNTTDAKGRRYCYGNQPQIAGWNLVRLANAIYPLVGQVEPLEEALTTYGATFSEHDRRMTGDKLGLVLTQQDDGLVKELHGVLQCVETDMTLFYRGLADVDVRDGADPGGRLDAVAGAWYAPDAVVGETRDRVGRWLDALCARARQESRELADPAQRRARLDANNPLYVMRNYLAHEAITRADAGDFGGVSDLQEVMRSPYTKQPGRAHFAGKRPEWARHQPGCSTLSCSS